jgi:hypothetical protein
MDEPQVVRGTPQRPGRDCAKIQRAIVRQQILATVPRANIVKLGTLSDLYREDLARSLNKPPNRQSAVVNPCNRRSAVEMTCCVIGNSQSPTANDVSS